MCSVCAAMRRQAQDDQGSSHGGSGGICLVQDWAAPECDGLRGWRLVQLKHHHLGERERPAQLPRQQGYGTRLNETTTRPSYSRNINPACNRNLVSFPGLIPKPGMRCPSLVPTTPKGLGTRLEMSLLFKESHTEQLSLSFSTH